MNLKTNGFGIASMVIGIVALLLTCCYGGFLGIVGLIFAIVGMCVKGYERGFAITGLVLNIISILTLFLLLLGVISVWNSDTGKATTVTPLQQDAAPPIETPQMETYCDPGTRIETNYLKIDFIAVDDYVSTSKYNQPKAGNKYIVLYFEIENASNTDEVITSWDFECYADGYAATQYYGLDDNLSATLSPGRKTTGTVAFEVPVDAEEIEVEYETNIWTGEKIVFKVK